MPRPRSFLARMRAESRCVVRSSSVKTGAGIAGGMPGPSKVWPSAVRNCSLGRPKAQPFGRVRAAAVEPYVDDEPSEGRRAVRTLCGEHRVQGAVELGDIAGVVALCRV